MTEGAALATAAGHPLALPEAWLMAAVLVLVAAAFTAAGIVVGILAREAWRRWKRRAS